MTTERFTSPDGDLVLVLDIDEETDDVTVSFDGATWHVHGDALAETMPESTTPLDAARALIDEIMTDRLSIGMQRVDGDVVDTFVTDDRDAILEQADPGEDYTFRVWSA